MELVEMPSRLDIMQVGDLVVEDAFDPKEDFTIVAKLWNALGFSWRDREVTAAGVALAIIAIKQALIVQGLDTAENFAEICGYAAGGREVADELLAS